MARIVKRFFILPNAASTHDLVDIRLMNVKPGTIMPAAIRRRPATTSTSQPIAADADADNNTNNSNAAVLEPAPTLPAPATKPIPSAAPSTDRPKAWHVILLDSDDHSYEYVIDMMMTIFRHPIERAFDIAQQVDKQGRAICFTTHRELAELRVEQVRGFGFDPRIASCNAAMRCYLEPAE